MAELRDISHKYKDGGNVVIILSDFSEQIADPFSYADFTPAMHVEGETEHEHEVDAPGSAGISVTIEHKTAEKANVPARDAKMPMVEIITKLELR